MILWNVKSEYLVLVFDEASFEKKSEIKLISHWRHLDMNNPFFEEKMLFIPHWRYYRVKEFIFCWGQNRVEIKIKNANFLPQIDANIDFTHGSIPVVKLMSISGITDVKMKEICCTQF